MWNALRKTKRLVPVAVLAATALFISANAPQVRASSTIDPSFLIVPGVSVGKLTLGMSPADVKAVMGEPRNEDEGAYQEYVNVKEGERTTVFFTDNKATEIRFNSKKFRTAEDLSLTSCTQKKWHKDFDFARLQTKFMNVRFVLKSGGLAIYRLNLDGIAKSPLQTVGLLYKDRPVHQARAYLNEPDGGWEAWDGESSTLWDEFKSTAARNQPGLSPIMD